MNPFVIQNSFHIIVGYCFETIVSHRHSQVYVQYDGEDSEQHGCDPGSNDHAATALPSAPGSNAIR